MPHPSIKDTKLEEIEANPGTTCQPLDDMVSDRRGQLGNNEAQVPSPRLNVKEQRSNDLGNPTDIKIEPFSLLGIPDRVPIRLGRSGGETTERREDTAGEGARRRSAEEGHGRGGGRGRGHPP